MVEDNPDNLELMRYLLNAYGHTSMAARNGEEGLAIARATHPDLILSDIHMPGLDGYGLATELRKDRALASIPRIAVTALAMLGDREKVLVAGFDGYIDKPIDPERFVGQVEGFLGLEPSAAPGMPQQQCPPAEETQPASRGLTVLVVDDHANNRDLIERTLRSFGFELFLADNIDDGVALARDARPDFILSDIHMAGGNGFDFLERVKQDPTLSSIPFLFVSASAWGDQEAKAREMGADRFLIGPLEPQTLVREIESLAGGH
jgi:two-component system cell cycle response regulator